MRSATKSLLWLATAAMAVATDQPTDPSAAAAAAAAVTVTVTVTEPACMTSAFGDGTPLAIAKALATAADVTAAASLVASIMADSKHGWNDTATAEPTGGTTTVTTFANATDCPAPPTLDVSPMGELASLLSNDLSSNNNATYPAVDSITDTGRWSQGRLSLCFTNSDYMLSGRYAVYLDGWGQEADGCGKGALDNLRGQCGPVLYWGCRHWGTGVLLTFQAYAKYSGCVLDAMWKASPHEKREVGLCCAYVGSSLTHGGKGAC